MVNYRQDKTQGGTYFITLTLKDRTSNLITKHIAALRHSFLQAQKNNPFTTLHVREELLPRNWGGVFEGKFGE